MAGFEPVQLAAFWIAGSTALTTVLSTGSDEAPARGITFTMVALVGAVFMATRPRFLIAGVVVVGLALAVNMWLATPGPGDRGGYGTFIENPNPAAWVLLAASLLLIGRRNYAAAIAAGIVLAPLVMTGSRLGAATAVVTLLALLVAGSTRRYALIAVLVAAAFLPAMTAHFGLFVRSSHEVVIYVEEHRKSTIIEVGTNGPREALDRILIGNIGLPTAIVGGSMDLTFYHNTPLQIAHDAGWIAALAWLYIVAVALWKGRRTYLLVPLISMVLVSTLDQYTWGYGVAALATWALLAEATRKKGALDA